MELQIRRAKADDMPHILAVQADAIRKLSGNFYNKAQIESLVRTQADLRVKAFNAGEEHIFVGEVESDGQPKIVVVGALMASASFVSGMFVHGDYARQGLSRQMMQRLEAFARQQEKRLLIVTSSMIAVPFYEAVGFSRVYRTMIRSENQRIDCVNMVKSLRKKEEAAAEIAGVFLGVLVCIVVVALAIALFNSNTTGFQLLDVLEYFL